MTTPWMWCSGRQCRTLSRSESSHALESECTWAASEPCVCTTPFGLSGWDEGPGSARSVMEREKRDERRKEMRREKKRKEMRQEKR